jgi:hypothetical protein
MIEILMDNLDHMNSSCTSYNNILALAATGVQNFSGTGGWCHDMVGDHAVKLQGRTYHFMPSIRGGVGPNGGLSYHLFDARAALAGHAESRRRTNANGTTTDVVRVSILERIYDDMRSFNLLAMEIADFGEDDHLSSLLDATNDSNMARVIATVRFSFILVSDLANIFENLC